MAVGLVPQRYRGMFNPVTTGTANKPPFTPNQAYPAAIEQGAEDYDDIMKRYRGVMDSPSIMANYGRQPLSYEAMSPETMSYSTSGDVSGAMNNLRNLAGTGGYSEGDISNLRARAVSPIRAVYGGALRNLNRQRSLSGGRALGYAGATARMAREQSEQIGGATTDINARLAEMVAQGKQAAAPHYASLASSEAARRTGVEQGNIDAINRAREGNIARKLQVEQANRDAMLATAQNEQAMKMNALQGMTSLYGTTPANAALFGSQVAQHQQVSNQTPRNTRRMGTGMAAPMSRAEFPIRRLG